MEQIGSDIPVRHAETVETTRQATQFRVLEFRVTPHNQEIWAEVSLFDSDGEVIGPARWVQLNPLAPSDGELIDNWDTLVDMTLREIGVKVKARLQGMEF